MKRLILISTVALIFTSYGYADQEHCEVMSKGAHGLEFIEVPCKTMEHKIPCAKEWTDENGSWHSEERPCAPGEQKTVEQVDREESAAQKRKCGKDFRALRVGMKFSRFEQCNEEPEFITDTMTTSGLVETYRGTFYIINVKNDRIISYTRRRY